MEIRSCHFSANSLIAIYFTLSKNQNHSWALNNLAAPFSADLTSCYSHPRLPCSSHTKFCAVPWMPRHPLPPGLSIYCLLWTDCSSPRHPQTSLPSALWVNVTLSVNPSLPFPKLSNTHSPNSLSNALLYYLHSAFYHLNNIPYFINTYFLHHSVSYIKAGICVSLYPTLSPYLQHLQ